MPDDTPNYHITPEQWAQTLPPPQFGSATDPVENARYREWVELDDAVRDTLQARSVSNPGWEGPYQAAVEARETWVAMDTAGQSPARLNDNLNALTEQRLLAARDAAMEAYRQAPGNDSNEAHFRLGQATDELDKFWEARTAEADAIQAETETALKASTGNLPGLPDNTQEWADRIQAEDERLRAKDLYTDDPEYRAPDADAEWVEPIDLYDDTAVAEAVGVMGTDHTLDNLSHEQISAAWNAPLPSRTLESAPNFADEVDAWYQAVQPTGDIRRVRDAELFDPNGYSQQPDAVAAAGPPVSKSLTTEYGMAGTQGDAARHEARMQMPPPPLVPPGPTMKL